MAKLHFYYSTMNAGKSTHLLQANHNYKSDGHNTMLLKPSIDDRMGVSVIGSRIGISAEAIAVSPENDLFDLVKIQHAKTPLTAVFVDETQFFNKAQIFSLAKIADDLGIAVLAYGLKNNFMGETFEGSRVLLELADNLREIKTTCHCGSKATMVLKYDQNGKVIRSGAEVDIGAEEKYVATCRKHFVSGDIGNTARKGLTLSDSIKKDKLATILSKHLNIVFSEALVIVNDASKECDSVSLIDKFILDIDNEITAIKIVHEKMNAESKGSVSILSVKLLEKSVNELEKIKTKIENLKV